MTYKEYTNSFDAIDDPEINSGFVWNKIFKREIITSNNIWFAEDITFAEDNLFLNIFLTKCNLIITQPGVLYHYQFHLDSTGNSIIKEKQLSNSITRCDYIIDYYVEQGYTDRYLWVLDFCLAITHDRIQALASPEKRKYYSIKTLRILEQKLLSRIDEVPSSLGIMIEDLKNYSK